jgi:Na+-driven multidrug efflux pump
MTKNFIKDYMKVYIPMFVSMLTIFIYNLADSYFISGISKEAFAGFGIASIQVLLMIAILSSIANAISVYISKAYGSKKKIRKRIKIFGGIIMMKISAFVLLLIYLIMYDTLYSFYSAEASVLVSLKTYFNYWVIFLPAVALNLYFQQVFNAINKAKYTMYILALTVFINIVLDYYLINGIEGIIPALGVKGAALATGISFVIGAIISGIYLQKQNYLIFYKISHPKLIISLKRMTKLSMHFLVPGLTYPLSMLIIGIGVSSYDTNIIASYALVDTFKYIVLTVTTATALTISILVSKYKGSKEYHKIKDTYVLSMYLIIVWSIIVLIITNLFGKTIGNIYLPDTDTVDIFTNMWVILIYGAIAWAVVANTGRLMLSFGQAKYASIMIFIGNVLTMIVPILMIKYYSLDYFLWSITIIGFITMMIAMYFYFAKIKPILNRHIIKND